MTLATITYRLRSPIDDRWTAVTVDSDGAVLGHAVDGTERRFRLKAAVAEDVLEALSAALDDSGFPDVPHLPHADAEVAEVDVIAEGRSGHSIIGLPVHGRDGGWAELVRILSGLLDQATLGGDAGTDSLPPCLDPA